MKWNKLPETLVTVLLKDGDGNYSTGYWDGVKFVTDIGDAQDTVKWAALDDDDE